MRSHPVVVAVLTVSLLSAVIATLLRHPAGLSVSSDPGYPPVPAPLLLVPALATIVLVLALPRGGGESTVTAERPVRLRLEAAALVGIALSFPLLVPLLPATEDYVLLKLALFMVLPGAALWLLSRHGGSSIRIREPEIGAWAVLPALLLGVTASVGPFSGGTPASWPELEVLVIASLATAITAGFGEELLYRRFLQTRLEVIGGRWAGILATSILFGLLHVPTHDAGSLPSSIAQSLAMQGTTGIALGLIWSRYRRLSLCVLAHVLLNGLAVALHLLGVL